MKLLNDVARCDGSFYFAPQSDAECLEPACAGCLRKTAPRPKFVWMMSSPKNIDGKCPERIEE